MKPVVIDASLVAAAFFMEEHAAHATEVLRSGAPLLAPELIYSEIANVIWKRRLRDEITDAEAMALLDDIHSLPLRITPASRLVRSALHVAMASRRSVYDCLYLSLAMTEKTRVLTADERFVNALSNTPFASHVQWIGQKVRK